MKEIPLLEAADIRCRVQSVNKSRNGNVTAVLLLYKNARVDMEILDRVFGPENWQRSHEVINGNLFCNIDIWDDDKRCWVRKQDVGTESNTEKEKGEASDSFKRAGFNVGIGRELYTAPSIRVALKDGEYSEDGNKVRCNPWTEFRVTAIEYDERRAICGLRLVDRDGVVRYDMATPRAAYATANGGGRRQEQPPQNVTQMPQRGEQTGGLCPECGGPISAAEQRFSASKYGRELCRKCQTKNGSAKRAEA